MVFALWGSVCSKATRKTLVKSNPGERDRGKNFTSNFHWSAQNCYELHFRDSGCKSEKLASCWSPQRLVVFLFYFFFTLTLSQNHSLSLSPTHKSSLDLTQNFYLCILLNLRVQMCVCVRRKRERERKRKWLSEWEWVCVCVYLRDREREFLCRYASVCSS